MTVAVKSVREKIPSPSPFFFFLVSNGGMLPLTFPSSVVSLFTFQFSDFSCSVRKKFRITSDNSHFRIPPVCFAFVGTEFQYWFLSQFRIVCRVFVLQRGGKKEGFTLFALLAIEKSLC